MGEDLLVGSNVEICLGKLQELAQNSIALTQYLRFFQAGQ